LICIKRLDFLSLPAGQSAAFRIALNVIPVTARQHGCRHIAPTSAGRSACADAQNEDNRPNMETYHENAYRCSRLGHPDCRPDIRPVRERGPDVAGELVIRVQRLLSHGNFDPQAKGL
jgi:hypothetical protein